MDPITVGVFIIAVVGVLSTGYAYFRSSAVKVWEQNAEAYKARVDLLEAGNKVLEATIIRLESRIHELESRPDWQAVLTVVGTSEATIVGEIHKMLAVVIANHEAREKLIADRLAAETARIAKELKKNGGEG